MLHLGWVKTRCILTDFCPVTKRIFPTQVGKKAVCAFTAPMHLIPEQDPTYCRLPCYVSDKHSLGGTFNLNIVWLYCLAQLVTSINVMRLSEDQFGNCVQYTSNAKKGKCSFIDSLVVSEAAV